MKKLLLTGFAVVLVLTIAFATRIQNARADVPTLLNFETMVGVPRPNTGSASPIQDLNWGGLPWVIASGYGELSMTGKLELSVRDLEIDPNDPAANATGLAGKKQAALFKAIVSCQSADSTGTATIINVSTPTFPATTGLASAGGDNARVETRLNLPHPCFAPVIFVTSATDSWFAAIGN